MDEVDRIVAAWRRERPDLDVAPMEVLSRVSRLSKQLDKARKSTFHDHELEVWAFDVLSALRRAGEPYELSPSRLISEMMVTSGTMTNRIDRLVKVGWVSRRPDPKDRRSILVTLTEVGKQKVDNALSDLLVHEADLLAELTDAQKRKLTELLRTLSTGFETGSRIVTPETAT
ncbi:MarR family winged helix-turn-helix transcriptional regulator [Brevibacterium gallinarum]|uniref:MarR family transcriptional regulator n=1 Tax=Brevibacterium gallinarum TaxID=2762220 RepID=A0ABR8WQS3_9MICO|nr:MarR family transcriptional regulator [Brevibacterium gallinarum]MBD8019335.1 MarR family transcriptional regulator [Brevibacterium gallinarum]